MYTSFNIIYIYLAEVVLLKSICNMSQDTFRKIKEMELNLNLRLVVCILCSTYFG